MTTTILPRKLAIYYGYPSQVNGSTSLPDAINTFNDYKLVILGPNIEQPTHPDHNNTHSIITDPLSSNTKFFGYIDCTAPILNIEDKIDLWATTGVFGIFCDKFGYDSGTDRLKQNIIIKYIHKTDLKAIVTSPNPDDVFGSQLNIPNNPLLTPPKIKASDWYLYLSFQLVNGEYENPTQWKTKSDKLITYRDSFGTKIACCSTYDSRPYHQSRADYSFLSATLYDFDAWGFGENNFASLPDRKRKKLHGNRFTTPITNPSSNIYERQTNIGIHLDTNNHTTDILLD